MKRRLTIALAIILVATGLFILSNVIYSFKNVEKGALQVTANTKSKVYLNGQYIGDTQLCKCDQNDTLNSGNYELRIEPYDKSLSAYTVRVKINGGVLTAVDKTFLPGSLGSSYVLTLENENTKKPSLNIVSIPDGALVTIDSVAVGATPFTTDALPASEHEIEIQKEGFGKKTIRVKTADNHILDVTAILGTGDENTILPSPTPTASASASPTPTVAQTTKVTILSTPNGFLRVRSGAGTTFSEVTKVNTGQTFTLLDEKDAWYEIQVDSSTTGWISSQYASKQ